jgi:hypothetical protein
VADRHNWISWDQYQNVHHSCLSDYLDYFILEDGLDVAKTDALVYWKGVLVCADGIEIRVAKVQEVRYRNGQPEVRTFNYSYHVLQRVEGEACNLFRYDNAHPHLNHPDPHHRHQYDDNGIEIEPARHVGADAWPTLAEVIEEAFKWWLNWQQHR